jgi:hypothetical protein
MTGKSKNTFALKGLTKKHIKIKIVAYLSLIKKYNMI